MATWPMSQDYNEAIQHPMDCFTDPELRQGEAVTNRLGLPVPCSGNFADVYAMTAGPRKWAVKCFTRQIPGLKERYAEVSKYLQQTTLPFMVDFRFLEQGVLVRGQWFPILKMQWVEGLALNAFVRENLDKPQILDALCQIWLKLAVKLREANLAHCDLQHGNVLMVQRASAGKMGVRLVDYDGTCVPALELLKSIELGHPAYQHPQRLREGTYGLEIDRFPHLVIYTAIRAIMAGGKGLWKKYDNGDNLLFRQTDFEAPRTSALFQELLKLNDPEVKKLAQAVAIASQNPIDRVPLLEQLVEMPKPKPAAITVAPVRRTGMGQTAAAGTANPFAGVDDESATAEPRRRTQHRGKRKRGLVLAGVAVLGLFITAAAGALFFGLRSKPRPPAVELVQAAVKSENSPAKSQTAKPPSQETTKPEAKGKPQPGLLPKIDSTPAPKFEPKLQPMPEPAPEFKPQPVAPKPPVPRYKSAKSEVLEGHTGKVMGVAFSADGKLLASSGEDKTVRQWDLTAKKESGRYEGNQQLREEMVGLVSAADGKSFCAHTKFEFAFYDFASRNQIAGRHQNVGNRIPYAAMALDTRNDVRILCAGFRTGGFQLMTFEGPRFSAQPFGTGDDTMTGLTFSRNGKFLFSGTTKGALGVWDMDQLRQPLLRFDGHQGAVRSLAASPDGKLLVSSGTDNEVRLWDTETGKELRQFPAGAVPAVAFSPDGRRVATAGEDKIVRVWNANSAALLQDFKGHTDAVICVAFSSDGSQLASGSADRTVRLWQIDKRP